MGVGGCLMGGWVGRPMRPQLVGPVPCCLLPPSPPSFCATSSTHYGNRWECIV